MTVITTKVSAIINRIIIIFSYIFALFAMSVSESAAIVNQNEAYNFQDPDGLYGHCGDPATSGVRRKAQLLGELGSNPAAHLDQITHVWVLQCRDYDGPGGNNIVPCPPGGTTVNTYCVQNRNDGAGNHVLLKVLYSPNLPCFKANVRTGPARIDVVIRNDAYGVDGFDANNASNARWEPISVTGARGPVILTFTKINQSQPASTGTIHFGLGGGLGQRTCSFNF